MNFEELLQAMGEDGGDRECPLTGEDAILALKNAATRFAQKHAFKAGDLIVQKDGLSTGSRAGIKGTNPIIFIRYQEGLAALQDLPPASVQYTASNPDCLIGWLVSDGGMGVYAVCSEAFEPYHPTD